jgi:hypothetical protein
MGPLAAVEHFLERLFERQSARLFRTGIRPVVILRRLERAMEDGRVREGARTLVPHRLVVRLQPDDLTALRAATPELAATLADGALAFARHHGYTLLERPVVSIRPDPRVDLSDVAVDAVAPAREPDGRPAAIAARASDPAELPPTAVRSEPRPAADVSADGTAVFAVPGVEGPRASIREVRPDGSTRTVEFDGRPLTIGRATDNRVVLRDGRASRHHARIDARRGSLVLTDLGSTNGSFVNDRRVDSAALGVGDRIRLGTTTMVVEAIDEEPSADVPTRPRASAGDASADQVTGPAASGG